MLRALIIQNHRFKAVRDIGSEIQELRKQLVQKSKDSFPFI